ncbi:ABC transporter permease [Corynebacterium sphenisci]|uniref:ABC transporter permease n=1 Tax=Corynebacterium sphenisci TaxID=191493 RepID=UPI000A03C7DA|nr:iron ABC transporter permease [Corynebacterium sphenisci]
MSGARTGARGGPSPLLIAAAALAVAAVAVPLVFLLGEAATAPAARMAAAAARPGTRSAAVTTAALVAGCVLGSLAVGVPTAVALTRLDLPAHRACRVAAALPLAVPSYVAALAWANLVPLRGYWASVLVLTLVTAPYVTLPTAAALRRADTRGEEVARTLGRGPVRAFLTMTGPQIAPAAASGALLVALYAISEYGVVAIMRLRTLTPAVQAAFAGGFNRELAMLLSVLLVAMAMAVVAVERAVRRPVAAQRVAAPAPATARRGRWAALAALAAVFAAAVGVPVGLLLARAGRSVAGGAVDWPRLAAAARVTVGLGLGGAAVAIALALPVAMLAARYRGPVASGLETAMYLAHGLPGIVLGLSMVYLALALAPGLYQSLGLLVLAYGILFAPKALGSARAALAQVPPALEDAARTLGRSPAGTWVAVTARLAWPGIAAGALLVALTVMKELPATLMLRPTGTDTLATRLWQLTDVVAFGEAAPYGLALVAVATVPALLLARDGGRR